MSRSNRIACLLAAGAAAGIAVGAAPTPTPSPASPGAAAPARTPTPAPSAGGRRAPKDDRARAAGLHAPRQSLEPGDRISLDLKDADLRDVLRSFARLARLNLVIDPEVHGSVTVSLHDVRWEDALEVILRSNGLGWVGDPSLVRVGRVSRLADETDP